MICPYCNSVRVHASKTDNIHAGRLDCKDCGRMIKWLSKLDIEQVAPSLQIVTETESTAFWNDFVNLVPSVEYEILISDVSHVGLFSDILTIVIRREEDDPVFVDLICAIPCLSRLLSELLGKSVDIRLSSEREWHHARECSIEHFIVFKSCSIPLDYIFLYYYCGIISINKIGSDEWIFSEIDKIVLLARKNRYKPAWVTNTLIAKYNLSLPHFTYLARCLDYHPNWAVIIDKKLNTS
jgi:hypothetical protein